MKQEKIYHTKEPLPNLRVVWADGDFSFYKMTNPEEKIDLVSVNHRSNTPGIRFSKKVNGKRVSFVKSYNEFYKDFFGVNSPKFRINSNKRKEFLEKINNYLESNNLTLHNSEIKKRSDEITVKCEYGHIFTRTPHSMLNSDNKYDTNHACVKCNGWSMDYTKEDFLLMGKMAIKHLGVNSLDSPQSTQRMYNSNSYVGPCITPLRRNKNGDRGVDNCWEDFWGSWDEFRDELGIGDVLKKQVVASYEDDKLMDYFMFCVNDLNRIPSSEEFRNYRCKSFNGASIYNKIRGEYHNYVNYAKEKTGYDYNTDFFMVNDLFVKSIPEVFFVNFLNIHNISFEYEPKTFKFNGFSKIPDFLINGVYYEIAGFSRKGKYGKNYNNRIDRAKKAFKEINVSYEIINFSDKFINNEFYLMLCDLFGVKNPLTLNSEVDFIKMFLNYDNKSYTIVKERLKSLLLEIKSGVKINQKSPKGKLIRSYRKKLRLRNNKIAAEFLGIEWDVLGNGRLKELHSPNLNKGIKSGDIFRFLVDDDSCSGVKEAAEKFNTNIKTINKYWDSEYNPYSDMDIKNFHNKNEYAKPYTKEEGQNYIKEVVKKYGCIPTYEVLKKDGYHRFTNMIQNYYGGIIKLRKII